MTMRTGCVPGRVETSCEENARYLQRVFAAQPAHVALADEVVGLPQIYANLVLLEVVALAPGLVRRAVDTVDALGCLACAHGRHKPGDCLAGMVGDEDEPTYCVCGAAR